MVVGTVELNCTERFPGFLRQPFSFALLPNEALIAESRFSVSGSPWCIAGNSLVTVSEQKQLY